MKCLILAAGYATRLYPLTENFPKPLAFALSHGLMNFVCRPQFMAYRIGRRPLTVHIAEKLGAMKVAWTSHEPKNERGKDAVIFEFYKPSVKFDPKRKYCLLYTSPSPRD